MSLMIYNPNDPVQKLRPLAGTPSDSVELTGTPTAPTPAQNSNDSSIATTQFVKTAISTAAPSEATTSTAGLMSAADKTKLDGVATAATANAPYTSTPAMDGTSSAGSSALYARGDHVHPTDTSRAPKSHASSGTTYGKGSDANYGHVKLSSSTSSTSGTSSGTAATPSAVKTTYDLAASRLPTIGKGVNLLKNWYFIGGGTEGHFPINTQRKTSYVGVNSIDEWQTMGNTTISQQYVEYLGNGLNIEQALDYETGVNLYTKEVTASLVIINSVGAYQVVTGTITVPNPPASSTTYQAFIYTTDVGLILGVDATGAVHFYIQGRSNTTIKMVAVKLELGSEQTLARQNSSGAWYLVDAVPSYQEELLRCRHSFTPDFGKGENLLRNWYFVNVNPGLVPLNSHYPQQSFTEPHPRETIDGWYLFNYNGQASVYMDGQGAGLVLDCGSDQGNGFGQTHALRFQGGVKLTASILTNYGLYVAHLIYNGGEVDTIPAGFKVVAGDWWGQELFHFKPADPTTPVLIRAVKLELGYDQTLLDSKTGLILDAPSGGDTSLEKLKNSVGFTPITGKGQNFLENAYFMDGLPINQRTAGGWVPDGPCIDRWCYHGTVQLYTEYGMVLTPASWIWQRLYPNVKTFLQGKIITISLIDHSGTLVASGTCEYWPPTAGSGHKVVATGTIPGSGVTGYYRIMLAESSGDILIENYTDATTFPGGNIGIRAIKLELGAQQTLYAQGPNQTFSLVDAIPNYQQELAKCQRQLSVYIGTAHIGVGSILGDGTGKTVRFTINTPVPMDSSGTSKSISYNDLLCLVNGTWIPVTGTPSIVTITNNLIVVDMTLNTTSTFTANTPVTAALGTNGGWMVIQMDM